MFFLLAFVSLVIAVTLNWYLCKTSEKEDEKMRAVETMRHFSSYTEDQFDNPLLVKDLIPVKMRAVETMRHPSSYMMEDQFDDPSWRTQMSRICNGFSNNPLLVKDLIPVMTMMHPSNYTEDPFDDPLLASICLLPSNDDPYPASCPAVMNYLQVPLRRQSFHERKIVAFFDASEPQ